MKRRIVKRGTLSAGLALLWAVALLVPPAARSDDRDDGTTPRAGTPQLPPVECVRLLREARIAHMRGDTETELARLRSAATEFPEEIAPVYALLTFDHEHGLPEEEHRGFRERFEQRLGDHDRPLPPSLLQQVARDPRTDKDLVRRITDSVTERLEAPADESEELLALLAELQRRLGRQREAAATLERLWKRTGASGTAMQLLTVELQLERWSRALEVIEGSEEMRRVWWTTHVRLLAETGRLDEALEVLDRHAARAEGDPLEGQEFLWALRDLAWSFRDAGRSEQAEALFRRALERSPGDADLESVLLHLYASDEERQAHAAEIERSRAEETDPRVLFDEGTQLLAAGNAEDAFGLLERAAPHLPRLEPLWFNLGMAAYRLERWPRVAEALGRAAELEPGRAASFFFRGVALTHLERCAEAVEALERALELDPDRTQSHYYLSTCYRLLDRPGKAEHHRKLYAEETSG